MCRWLLTLSDDQLIKTAFTDETTFCLCIELICFLKIRLIDFFNLNSNYIYVKLYVSDGSLNVHNCTRYIESRRRGGAGRNGLADKLLHQTDKFPSKLMVFLGTCAGRVLASNLSKALPTHVNISNMLKRFVYQNSGRSTEVVWKV